MTLSQITSHSSLPSTMCGSQTPYLHPPLGELSRRECGYQWLPVATWGEKRGGALASLDVSEGEDWSACGGRGDFARARQRYYHSTEAMARALTAWLRPLAPGTSMLYVASDANPREIYNLGTLLKGGWSRCPCEVYWSPIAAFGLIRRTQEP